MSIQEDKLTEIANAIRTKKGTTAKIVANNFAKEILSIPKGSGNATPSDVLAGKTFTNDNGEQTGTIPTYSGSNIITPSRGGETLQTQGKYLSTNLNIMGDLDLKPENIKQGVNIFGVTGNLEDVETYSNRITSVPYAVQPLYYGVKFTGSNPAGLRTGLSKDFVVNIAHSVNEQVRNDFDNIYPFNQIKRVTNNGREMIQIPKFYIWLSLDFTDIKISEYKLKDYALPNAFKDIDGSELPYTQIGAYHTSNNNTCVSGATPQPSQTRKFFRDNARGIGKGWCDIDVHAYQLYWILWLVVTANRDTNAIMTGNSSGRLVNTGGTRGAVSSLVQIGNQYQSFYGIENMYSNLITWIDGINFENQIVHICNDFSKYADDTSVNYINVGTKPTIHNRYIVSMKKLNEDIIMVDNLNGGTATTYWCEKYYTSNGWKTLASGSTWSGASNLGLFCFSTDHPSNYTNNTIGSRLVYRPLK